jgi:hypothetical protein
MVRWTRVIAMAGLAAATLSLTACERTITNVESETQALACTDCHVDNNLITGKQAQWAQSKHGTGLAYIEEGTNRSCAGCHSGNAFQQRIEAGLHPNQLTDAIDLTDPTPQDCRACHQIHETYTMTDFTLRTSTPVSLYAIPGSTFDGGEGNLCVNCHQPRRNAPVAVNGTITGITTHWGPHHGPQSSMLLGVGAAIVTGTPHGHYGGVTNTCVHCHMGDDRDHHFEPEVSRCQTCHVGATSFDINGRQTEIRALADSLGAMLVDAGLLSDNTIDGHPIVTSAPEAQGNALWNWLYVHHEDRSDGVHNYPYTKAMLEAGLAAMATPPPAPLMARSSH